MTAPAFNRLGDSGVPVHSLATDPLHCGAASFWPETAQLSADRAQVTCARCQGCHCGSGAHPRRCPIHPGAYECHVAELNADPEEGD